MFSKLKKKKKNWELQPGSGRTQHKLGCTPNIYTYIFAKKSKLSVCTEIRVDIVTGWDPDADSVYRERNVSIYSNSKLRGRKNSSAVLGFGCSVSRIGRGIDVAGVPDGCSSPGAEKTWGRAPPLAQSSPENPPSAGSASVIADSSYRFHLFFFWGDNDFATLCGLGLAARLRAGSHLMLAAC